MLFRAFLGLWRVRSTYKKSLQEALVRADHFIDAQKFLEKSLKVRFDRAVTQFVMQWEAFRNTTLREKK